MLIISLSKEYVLPFISFCWQKSQIMNVLHLLDGDDDDQSDGNLFFFF